jgi:hypothetical protein
VSTTKNFEVIAVNGNNLVYRDQNGTQEITVPSDFRFTVDGKPMAVGELKPGMKGTATVTTTTTITPVVVTEVREGEVLRASDLSMTVRTADGNTRRFTQGELNKRGIEIVKDGKAVRIADLKKGDKLSAVIITSGPPVVLTEKEVQAVLAEPAEAAVAQAVAAAAPAPAGATGAPPPAAPKSSAAVPASPPADTGMGLTWIWIALAIAIVVFPVHAPAQAGMKSRRLARRRALARL